MEEIWKDIKNWQGFYQVSSEGRVRSLERTIVTKKNTKLKIESRILSIAKNKWGYNHVTFWLNRKQQHKKVHIMVAEYFVEKINGCNQVNHKDKNKDNNHYTNLEWVSNRENCSHSHDKKRCTSKYTGVSFKRNLNKWVAQAYISGQSRYLGLFETEEDASDAYQNALMKNNIINRHSIKKEKATK